MDQPRFDCVALSAMEIGEFPILLWFLVFLSFLFVS